MIPGERARNHQLHHRGLAQSNDPRQGVPGGAGHAGCAQKAALSEGMSGDTPAGLAGRAALSRMGRTI